MARVNPQSKRSDPPPSADQTGAFDGSPFAAGNSPADVTRLPDPASLANDDVTTAQSRDEDVTTFQSGDEDVTTFQSGDEDVTSFHAREEDVTTFRDPGSDVTAFRAPGDDVTTFKAPDPPARPATERRPTKPPTQTSATRGGGKAGAKRTAQGPIEVGQSFGSRYHIIKVLGVGGMGAVYQAFDAELGVTVALKVIRPEITADPAAALDIERRFKRELLLARQVTHPNVVRIHDLGDIDGIKYITMHYIEGADLATILSTDRKLPIPRSLRIARGIVSGLVSAHQAGVVHRDLKPANIMVGAEDVPTIMDFGIARSAGGPALGKAPAAVVLPTQLSRTAAAAASSTVAGAIVGTVAYMAPEQARGEEVDQRADIYAFGLILYDMLIGGRRSERAASAVAELQNRMQQAPPAPRTIDAAIPDAVDAIIRRCLEPDPAKRFQTTVELQHALDRLNDEGKPLPMIRRLTRRGMMAAAIVVLLLLTGTFFTAQWLFAPAPVHDPVSVIIADLQNNTGDPTFDNLGQTMRRALEGASFISAYDRSRIRAVFGVPPPEELTEVTARELALKQGVGVVLAGSITPTARGYEITVKGAQTVTGEEIATARSRISSKDQVLESVTRVMASVRKQLGDNTSESDQLFAMRSLSTGSLDVVTHYAAAVEAQATGRMDEARLSYLKAVELDPKFGLGYQGLAAVSRSLGRPADAEKYIKEALTYLDSMTDRERMATRGLYYRMIGDNQQCAKEYGELLARYPADAIAHSQRAGCLAKLRELREAVAELQQAVNMLPNHSGVRTNLAFVSASAGDFEASEREVKTIPTPDARALQALAYSQIGRGLVAEATATYQTIGGMGPVAASIAASGLADIAMYEGRFADAILILQRGATNDLATKSPDRAALKFAALAFAHLMSGQQAPAVDAAERALENGKSMAVRFLAARVFAEAGEVEKARPIAAALSAELPAEPQAHGKIIEGLIALKTGKAREAVTILTGANALLDTWFGHFDLGRAYLDLKAYPQADSEFDACILRRGEALSLMDEGPTFGHFAIAYYYQGRVREELKTAGFADAYREYLKIRGESTEDPLVPEVRRRVAN